MTQRDAWLRPGAEEVAEGVHRIPLPLPTDVLKAVNVYLVFGENGVPLLIDGGWHVRAAQHELNRSLRDLGAAPSPATRCLVTHHHRDHYSLALHLRRTAGVRVYLGEGERENLAGGRDRDFSLQLHRAKLQRCGASAILRQTGDGIVVEEDMPAQDYEDPDVWVHDSDVFEVGAHHSLRARATPGHTVGHVVYIDDDRRVMFTGDHLLPHITPSIGLEPSVVESPLVAYLDSLSDMLRERDMTMLPAHGPAGGSTHERATALLAHHEVRLADTETAVKHGAATAYEAAESLTWTRHERSYSDLDIYNQTLAAIETLSHLDALVAQGRLSVRDEAGVGVYAVW